MHRPATKLMIRVVLGAAFLLSLPSQAQQNGSSDSNVPAATARKQVAEVAAGGPARWQTEDSSVQARLRSIRKEAVAGLQENLGNCRAMPRAERAACNREARTIYQQEMAGAQARAATGN